VCAACQRIKTSEGGFGEFGPVLDGGQDSRRGQSIAGQRRVDERRRPGTGVLPHPTRAVGR
jgi:hypothetical protein